MNNHSASMTRGRVSVGIKCEGGGGTRYLHAQISEIGDYWETATPIEAGAVIHVGLLRKAKGDLGKLPGNTLPAKTPLDGMVARHRLAAGTILQHQHLAKAALVSRGQKVILESSGSGFRVTREAEAMGDGSLGEVIRVRLSPRETITAVVTGPGKVKLSL